MQKHLLMWGTVLVAAILAAGVVGWATPSWAADEDANMAQVDLTVAWTCTSTNRNDIPDLRLALNTTGGPLWVTLVLGLEEPDPRGPEAVFEIFPVLDGQPQTRDTLRSTVWPGIDRQGFGTFTFVRAYQVLAGAHTVSWQVVCYSPLTVLRGWMTVYELPMVKAK